MKTMARKVFTYKGKTLEELEKLSLKELAALMPSRQRRKISRGLSDNEKALIEKLKKKDHVKTHLRDMIVLPSMVGKIVRIHNGKTYEAITIPQEAIGYYLGELTLTRKKVAHTSPGIGATKSSSNVSVK